MTLLTIGQEAVRRLPDFEVPGSIVGNTNKTATLLLALAKEEGESLRTQGTWTAQQREWTITTVAGQATYDPPARFRRPINRTWWDRSNNWRMIYASPATWQQLKSGLITEGVFRYFRFRDGQIEIHPTPSTAGETLVLEYLTDAYCTDSGGTNQEEWAADTDLPLLPEYLFRAGLKWRFKKEHGLPYLDDRDAYERMVEEAFGGDGGAPQIAIDGSSRIFPADGINVPEGSWPAA